MDWGRIKSIFIIAFLILDLFLLSQLMAKYKDNPEVKSNPSFEEKLKNEGISYKDLPVEIEEDYYIKANTKLFSEKELVKLEDQLIIDQTDNRIEVILESPILLDDKKEDMYSELKDFVKTKVLGGENYSFWQHDKEAGTIIFYQKFNGRFLMLNSGAHLVFHLSEDDDVVSYEQTMLDFIEPITEKENVLSAMRGLQTLFEKGVLKSDSKVKAELGYYTLVSKEATQVLTPTWHFTVAHNEETDHFFVNAFEGKIIQLPTSNDKNMME